MEVNSVQPSKAFFPMMVRLRYKVRLVNPLFREAYSPMLARVSGMVRLASAAQPSKEEVPMELTAVGMLILARAAQPEKADEEIRVPTLPLKLTEVSAEQSVQ